MAAHHVALLFSPRLLPQYNGSVGAGNGSLKTHLRQEALRQGRPDVWTSQDVAAAVASANALSHPHGPCAPTPDEAWAAAGRLSQEESGHFLKTLDDARREVRMERELTSEELIDRAARATVDRAAIRRTLVRRGSLYSREPEGVHTLTRRSVDELRVQHKCRIITFAYGTPLLRVSNAELMEAHIEESVLRISVTAPDRAGMFRGRVEIHVADKTGCIDFI